MTSSSIQPRILSTGDWHLGHHRVPTLDTISDIRKHLLPKISTCDILVIAGDIFDGKISFNDDNASAIIKLFSDIIRLCYEYNVIFRILRGTFSHDLNQNTMIKRLHKELMIPLNFKLIESLTIEHIDRFNVDILYMPDNLPYSTKSDVFDAVKKLLVVNNLSAVDTVIAHAEFDHMNFGFVNHNAYSVSDFDTICKGLILSGHIHKPNVYRNVIYTGSINRLAHNEEEHKGFWMVQGVKSTFIPNPDATRFITIDYRDETDFNVVLVKHIESLKQFSTERLGFLRLLTSDSNIKQAIIRYHNANHPNIRLSFKSTLANKASSKYLSDKLKNKKIEVLEVPSVKNIANIVYNDLMIRGITLNIDSIEKIING